MYLLYSRVCDTKERKNARLIKKKGTNVHVPYNAANVKKIVLGLIM